MNQEKNGRGCMSTLIARPGRAIFRCLKRVAIERCCSRRCPCVRVPLRCGLNPCLSYTGARRAGEVGDTCVTLRCGLSSCLSYTGAGRAGEVGDPGVPLGCGLNSCAPYTGVRCSGEVGEPLRCGFLIFVPLVGLVQNRYLQPPCGVL